MASAGEGDLAVSLADVQAAAKRIEGAARVTPVHTSATMDRLSGKELFFKCELFQKVGAFKFRGALNAIKSLDTAPAAVVTHSSGNHAQALAAAAQLAGIRAVIVMPENCPPCKRLAVADYGAEVILCESTQQARQAAVDKVLAEVPGSIHIPSYDHPHIMAGQGTMALELMEQVKDLDAIIVPVGGGGMISGVCVAAKGLNPDIKIYAAEPLLADDCARSVAAGKRILLDGYPDTVADGLRTSTGVHTFPVIQRHVHKVMTVTEQEIVRAMRLVWERMKLVVEPSAGVPVAVALKEEFKGETAKRVGIILCGGNQDLDRIPWVLDPAPLDAAP